MFDFESLDTVSRWLAGLGLGLLIGIVFELVLGWRRLPTLLITAVAVGLLVGFHRQSWEYGLAWFAGLMLGGLVTKWLKDRRKRAS